VLPFQQGTGHPLLYMPPRYFIAASFTSYTANPYEVLYCPCATPRAVQAEAEGRHDDAHLLNLQGQQVGISEACGWR
jgi:hypothetical protein